MVFFISFTHTAYPAVILREKKAAVMGGFSHCSLHYSMKSLLVIDFHIATLRSFRNATASICRIRSRVTPILFPTSSSVCASFDSIPNLAQMTARSLFVNARVMRMDSSLLMGFYKTTLESASRSSSSENTLETKERSDSPSSPPELIGSSRDSGSPDIFESFSSCSILISISSAIS